MKAIAGLLLCLCLDASGQTNIISFTNASGTFVSNAVAVKIAANKLMYTYADGGGVIRLDAMPPNIKKLFNYDATNAAIADKFDEYKRVDASNQAAYYAYIRWADEQRTEQRNELFKHRLDGIVTVIQKLDKGMLVMDSQNTIAHVDGMYFTDSIFDGDKIHLVAYPCGQYIYTTVTGTKKTVRELDTCLDCAVDKINLEEIEKSLDNVNPIH